MAAHFLYGEGSLERMETMMDFKHFEENNKGLVSIP